MKVRDILALKGSAVFTIKPTDTVAALSSLLSEKRIGAVVVSNDGQSIDGVISERDIAYGLARYSDSLHSMLVSALMTTTVIRCSLDDDIALVASTMLSRNVRHLPVEDAARVVGMVSIRDVLNLRLEELQQQTAGLRTQAHEATLKVPQDRE